MTTIDLHVSPYQARFGAEVDGVDASVPPNAELIVELKQRIAEHGFIVIREQHLTEDQHVAFTKGFGDITVPWLNSVEQNTLARIKELPGRPGYTGVHPGTVYFCNGPEYRDEPDDGYLQGWHADMTHLQVPLCYACLNSLEAPDYGYETWLSDQYLAYEQLDEETRKRVDDLSIVHSFAHVFPNLPKVIQPVVLTHPISGRRAIYGIPGVAEPVPLGVSEQEAEQLLEKLTAHLTSGQGVYKHSWKKGDLLIWDNRCVLHRRGPQAKGQTRVVRRIMAGDGDPPSVRQFMLGQQDL
jgi:taurine dioxygenase